ncbi:PilW family protein [Limisalsivibrio acetivorans]|uniref:PilW family protein n=1 Tax=Limisalsivibrio acetivorans TaxID=1304888 RepID=UPI0003B2EBF9|nr:prepilin-type N-terminal cleavage/methylation domain-containing protein [Limisalsivibrio acetivorans]
MRDYPSIIRKGIKGFSLVELLVVLGISGILITALYTTYIKLYSGYKQGTKIVESQVEGIINSEIIRTDIQNAGFGIGDGETKTGTTNPLYPIEWDGTNLTIYSTYNRLDNKTHGYALLKCIDNVTNDICEIESDKRDPAHYDGLKVISTINDNEISYVLGTVTSPDFYALGFPYDDSGVNPDKYVAIPYFLSKDCNGDDVSDLAARCNPNTDVLCRGTVPLVDCVADVRAFAGYIDNATGDIIYDEFSNIGNSDLNDVHRFMLYVLVQEGQRDNDFDFGRDTMVGQFNFSGDNISDSVSLDLPDGGENYRWNIINVDVKTLNIR